MLPDVKPLLEDAALYGMYQASGMTVWPWTYHPLLNLAWNLSVAGALARMRRVGFMSGLAVCTFDEARYP